VLTERASRSLTVNPRSTTLPAGSTRLRSTSSIVLRSAERCSVQPTSADLDEWIEEYNEARPHQGRWCFGKTPMQTFLDAMPMTKEKMIAANGDGRQNLIAQPGTSCPIEFRLIQMIIMRF
jgi:hypothetical protein